MVKTLGIDLEEDRGDVIGLDVQDKVNITIITTIFTVMILVFQVMEDITQGVLAICGNSGARNEVAKKMKVYTIPSSLCFHHLINLCQL